MRIYGRGQQGQLRKCTEIAKRINPDAKDVKKDTMHSHRKLPNTMVTHLKRFALDYTTFETMKINSRMTFETRLNMKRFTQKGRG